MAQEFDPKLLAQWMKLVNEFIAHLVDKETSLANLPDNFATKLATMNQLANTIEEQESSQRDLPRFHCNACMKDFEDLAMKKRLGVYGCPYCGSNDTRWNRREPSNPNRKRGERDRNR